MDLKVLREVRGDVQVEKARADWAVVRKKVAVASTMICITLGRSLSVQRIANLAWAMEVVQLIIHTSDEAMTGVQDARSGAAVVRQ